MSLVLADRAHEKIWRYMDMTQFMSVLEYQGIFFQHPTTFFDPYETTYHKDAPEKFADEVAKSMGLKSIADLPIESLVGKQNLLRFNSSADVLRHVSMRFCNSILTSCWHHNNDESEAMWQIYTRRAKNCIAITTTIQSLHDILPGHGDVLPIQYCSGSVGVDSRSHLNSMFFKRVSFAYEREVRAFFIDFEQFGFDGPEEAKPDGKWIKIPFDSFINEVWISPYADSWLEELVKKIIITYNLKTMIKRSAILDLPTGEFRRL